MGYFTFFGEDKSKRLSHHGIKGQKWGVRRFQNYDGTRIKEGKRKLDRFEVSDKNYNAIEKIYSNMPLADKKFIDPDITDEKATYFKSKDHYKKVVAFNSVSPDGFILAEKIPKKYNVDGTKGVEIGVGVIKKGEGVGTRLTKDLVDWFDDQNEYDVIWWPVDEKNTASIHIATKNGFIKDPLGDNYVYAKDDAMDKLGISDYLKEGE